jgi:RNA polymerase-binding transcription factor DksA
VSATTRNQAERAIREDLITQRGLLLRLLSQLKELASDDSTRTDAAKVPNLELGAQRDVLEARLHDVNEALRRLREGTYGPCVGCGDDIPLGRLQAKPDADRCVPCAQGAEP